MSDEVRKLSDADVLLRNSNVGLQNYTAQRWNYIESAKYLDKALAGQVQLCRTRPTFAQPGDIYFYVFTFNEDELQYESRFDAVYEDAFQFSVSTTNRSDPRIVRVYSYVNDKQLKKRLDKDKREHPKRYTDFHKATINSSRTAVAVLYTGALSEAGQTPHGNSKDPNALPFKRQTSTTRKHLANILKAGPSQKPKDLVKTVTYQLDKLENVSDQARELLKPTLDNTKRAKQAALTSKYISPDPLFSVYQLCHDNQVIHYYRLWPTFIVVFSSEQCISLTKELMQILKHQSDAPFQLAYDTTFNCGSFYLSALVARNFLLEGSPLFPVILMMHDRRQTETHTLLWDVFMKLCSKEFMPVAHLIPITVDREYAITKAIRFYCKERAQITFCKLHLVKNFETMLRRKRNFKQRKTTLQQYKVMCEAQSEDEYESLLKIAKTEWPADVVKKYLDPHRGYDHPTRTKSAAFAVSHFTVFREKPATNNVSESYNSMIKRLDIGRHSRIDYIILQILEDGLFTISDMLCAMNRKKSASNYRINSLFQQECSLLASRFKPVGAVAIETTIEKVRLAWQLIVDSRDEIEDPELVSKQAALLQAVNLEALLVTLDNGSEFSISATASLALVRRTSDDFQYLVQFHKGQLVCSCNMSKKCQHVYAVKLLVDQKSLFSEKQDTLNPQALQARYMTRSRLTGSKGAEPKQAPMFKTNFFSETVESARDGGEPSLSLDHRTSFMHTLEVSEATLDDDQEMDDVSLFKTEFEDNYATDSHFQPLHSTPLKHILPAPSQPILDHSIVPSIKRKPSIILDSPLLLPRVSTCVKRIKFPSKPFESWNNWASKTITNADILEQELLGLKPGQYLTQSNLDDTTALLLVHADDETLDHNDQVCRQFLHIPTDIVVQITIGKIPHSHFFAHSPAAKALATFYFLCDRSGATGHWVLGLICFTSRRVIVFDSLFAKYQPERRKHVFAFAKRYITLAHLFAGYPEDMTKWKYIFATDAPKQRNGFDCGIFAFHIVHAILHRVVPSTFPPPSDVARTILYETLTDKALLNRVRDAELYALSNMDKACFLDTKQLSQIPLLAFKNAFAKERVAERPFIDHIETIRDFEVRGGTEWQATCTGPDCKYDGYDERPHIVRCIACKKAYHSDCFQLLTGRKTALCTTYFYCTCQKNPLFEYLSSPEKSIKS
ncbi:hypothetical protein HDE_06208 [Halotydeus destructor]|nr:hypothetical protein HDE_06208 [Halotydeus destructor]